jgi:hypothetical protein
MQLLVGLYDLRNSSGSFAKFVAIRLASSLVSSLAADRAALALLRNKRGRAFDWHCRSR